MTIVESMCLVKGCRELEESFGTRHVEAVIRGNAVLSGAPAILAISDHSLHKLQFVLAAAKEMKETIYQQDGPAESSGRMLGESPSDYRGSKASWLGSIVGCVRLWMLEERLLGESRVMSHHGRGS